MIAGHLYDFLSGTVAMGFAVAGLFFFRFWWRTGEGLFAAFAAAFWLLGLTQGLQTFASIILEERSWLFLLRLAAFTLILLSIAIKNRSSRGEPRS